MPAWMIYGANGYMGELMAREAKERGLHPILAGRDARALTRLGQELSCEVWIFDLADQMTLVKHLTGVAAVLHCVGLFSTTSRPMLDACLWAGVCLRVTWRRGPSKDVKSSRLLSSDTSDQVVTR